MDASRYIVCLWPGLPELWHRGRWSALAPALGFALVVNFLIIARFIYPEWLVPALVKMACWASLGVWVVLVSRAVGQLPKLLYPRAASQQEDRYGEARAEYLRGDWSKAEGILAGCLEIDARDCPALLLLAGVYRQTGRYDAAEQTLGLLDRLETADGWWLERQAERKRLQRARSASESEDVDNAEPAAEMDEITESDELDTVASEQESSVVASRETIKS